MKNRENLFEKYAHKTADFVDADFMEVTRNFDALLVEQLSNSAKGIKKILKKIGKDEL